MKEYGITKVKFEGDKKHSPLVQFGDGLTGIQSLTYNNGDVGIVMCRDGKHQESFGFNDDKDTYASSKDKIFLAFDNPKSIDVMIARLEEAKGYLD